MSEIVATGISEIVLQQLESQGLPLKRSMNIQPPEFPADITLVDDQELMVMAGKYMENLNFLRTQVACANLAELEATNSYDLEVAKGLLMKTTGKSTEKAVMLKAAVATDEYIMVLDKAKNYAHAYRKLLETALENLERSYSLTSRELTRRTSSSRMMGNRFVP